MVDKNSLQQSYAPNSICFGCGPLNAQGLKIQSYPNAAGKVEAQFKPAPHHEAFPGMVNGGIIGALLDCHSNWTAAWHLMEKQKLSQTPCTVTAEYKIELKRPTPSQETLHLEAWVKSSTDDRVWVEATLTAGGKVCARCEGLFVAVKEGHPAYHRWGR